MKCPDCGSERVKRAGKYRGKYKTSQGYRASTANASSSSEMGLKENTARRNVIVWRCPYVEGLSLSKIREFLWQHFGYKPIDHAMLCWVKE
ncbi:MAG: hypothetical protein APU95_01810 [Hadesarchaea archaeon YNP_N21]|nr:MAG: hypothetical protein APU95_01810 [Hadesarchaea archaeon YNP_N21]